MACLDENTLVDYLSGQLDDRALADVEAHLESGCLDCREALTMAARVVSPATPPGFDRGRSVGRYLLISRLGRGAMGVVWTAYDPELDRKIAIKLVRPDPQQGEAAEAGRARLVREAQSLARLAHPNVIAVYDVGDAGDQIFIAMELVRGVTLDEWLALKPRTQAEILDVFHQAGTGLSAAHAAQLVHRDFKPPNVVVGEDGRVRVVDFGLARAEVEVSEDARRAIAIVTRGGVVVGTPAYMAPELRIGAAADARADQYSFCVALCEALVGTRPVAEIDPVLRDRKLPAWLQKVLLRGLQPDRNARFPAMTDLLAALERDPAARRRRIIGAIAALGIVAVAAVGIRVGMRGSKDLCRAPERKLAGVWDAPRREQLAARFRIGDLPYAESAISGTIALLDHYAESFAAMQAEACGARVRGEQSEALLDLRMACLDDRRQELLAATDMFVGADASVIRGAVGVAGALTPLVGCADVAALRGLVPPPAGIIAQRTVSLLSEQIAAARVRQEGGNYAAGRVLATQTVTEARTLDYAPLLGEALRVEGQLAASAGDPAAAERSLTQAVLEAERGRDDRGAAEARVALAIVIDGLGRHAEALRWVELAAAGLGRISDDPLLRARVLDARGRILGSLARWADARRDLEIALETREHVLDGRHRDVGTTLLSLGKVARDGGRAADALGYYERSLRVLESALGPLHPDLADVMEQLGATLGVLARKDEARRWLERAIDLRVKSLGPRHPSVAAAHLQLGRQLRLAGALDRARVEDQEALRIGEAAYGRKNAWLALPLVELAEVELARGDAKDAVPLLERALSLPARGIEAKPEITFPLARALWDGKIDRRRALSLFVSARGSFDVQDRASADAVDKWMRAHAVSSTHLTAEDDAQDAD